MSAISVEIRTIIARSAINILVLGITPSTIITSILLNTRNTLTNNTVVLVLSLLLLLLVSILHLMHMLMGVAEDRNVHG